MRSLLLRNSALLLLTICASATPLPNNTCTPLANGYDAIDDSPTINAALKQWGEVRNVSITNVDMDFRAGQNDGPVGTCLAFDHGTDGVQVHNVTCRQACTYCRGTKWMFVLGKHLRLQVLHP